MCGCSLLSRSSHSERSYTTRSVYKRSPLLTRTSRWRQWHPDNYTPAATIKSATATIIIINKNNKNNIVRDTAADNVTPTPQMVAKQPQKQTAAQKTRPILTKVAAAAAAALVAMGTQLTKMTR